MTVKLTSDEMRYITLFEGITHARVHDCVIDEQGRGVTFVVKKGNIGLAIGKNGDRIRKVRQMIGKSVEVIEHSDDPIEFLKNTLAPARVKEINIVERDGKKVAIVVVEREYKGMAIGLKGRKIQKAKKLAQRHHEIHDISLA